MYFIEKAGTNVRSNHFDCAGKRKSLRKSSEFKGVRMRKWGKWVSEIRVPRSRDRIWLGSYDTPEKAARAYDAALYCLRGAQGGFNFNFPAEKRPQIHSELSVDEIKEIAVRFAMLDSGRSEVSEDMGECSWSSSTVSTETSSPEILFSGFLEDLPKMGDSVAGGFESGGFSLESLLVEDPDLPELDGFWDL